MKKPSDAIIESIAPSREILEKGAPLPISDGYSVRNVAHAEQLSTMRLPRGGAHEATLVLARKYYDGSGGGEAGHYALLYVEFRAEGSRWRTAGVKVRAVEGTRIARDASKLKPSKPGRSEPDRVGGKTVATEESDLYGAPVADGYLIYVRHKKGSNWARTRGVELLPAEIPVVAALLTQLASQSKK